MVFRLLSNNWFSVLINGQPKGFFKSTRGLKQGDPLSSTLFIIAAELMSRALNSLLEKQEFKAFGMPRDNPRLNHLAFMDDMIILCKVEVKTMQLVADKLRRYEEVSCQKVNKEKSAIYMHHSVSQGEAVVPEVALEILRKEFSFTFWVAQYSTKGNRNYTTGS